LRAKTYIDKLLAYKTGNVQHLKSAVFC